MALEEIAGLDPVTGLVLNAGADIINSLIRQGRLDKARDYIENMPIPDLDKMTYQAVLQEDPEKLMTVLQRDTRLADIQEDPRLRDAQSQALMQLQERGRDGYTIEDKAIMERTMNEALNAQRGANMAADSQMARRGISGSGIDLAGRLARQQAGVQSARQTGLDVAARGRQQALQAMQGAGQLGGQIRGQEWGQKAQVAGAGDAIDRFNTANRMSTQQHNIQNQMAVNAANQGAQNTQLRHGADAYTDQQKMEADKDLSLAKTYM